MRNHQLLIVLFVFAATAFAAPAAFAEPQEDLQTHLEDATSLYHAGHWDAAREALQKVYDDADPGSQIRAAAALQLGSLLWERGDYARAHDLVRQSLDIARDRDMDEATGELLSTLGHIEASRGQLASAENTLNICVQLTGEMGDQVYRALCRLNRRVVRTLRGKDPGSDHEYRDDIEALQNGETSLSMGASLAKTAQLYRDNDDFERARQLLDQAQQVYENAGSVPGLRRNQLRIAQLLHTQEQYEEARTYVDGLADQFESMGNRPMLIHTLAIEAEYDLFKDDRPAALAHYQRALELATAIDNPNLAGRIHVALCELNISQSLDHCRQAAQTFGDTGMVFLEIRALSSLGRTLQRRQMFSEARQAYRQSIDKLDDAVDTTEDPHALNQTLHRANLCQVEAHLAADTTLATCTAAVAGFEAFDEDQHDQFQEVKAATYHSAGRAARRQNEAAQALEFNDRAVELYLAIGESNHRLLAADTLLHMGAIQNRLSEHRDRAPDTFRRALDITDDLDLDDDGVAKTHISLLTQLGQRHLADETWSSAATILERLSDDAQSADDLSSAAWAHSGLGRAYLKLERRDDAINTLEQGLELARQAGDDELQSTIQSNLERLRQ